MTIGRSPVWLVAAGMILAACVSEAGPPAITDEPTAPIEAPVTTSTPAADAPDGVWDTAPEVVPDGVDAPIADGGTLLNSLEAADRVVVSLSYPGDRRGEIASLYADWAERVGATEHDQGTMRVGAAALWFERWSGAGVEVRMVDCIHPEDGDFTLTCVAITTERAPG